MHGSSSCPPKLQSATLELCDSLARLHTLHEKLLGLLGEQERVLVEVRTDEFERVRTEEEGILRSIIEEEKERLLLTEELGDLLEHERPAEIKVAEILPHLPENLAVRLTGMREKLRDIALRLGRQNSVNRALIEHSVGHIQIFIGKLASEAGGAAPYDRSGQPPRPEGDSYLFDRRI